MTHFLKYPFSLLLVIFINLHSLAQSTVLPVTMISDSIKTNAHAVIRKQQTDVVIKSDESMRIHKNDIISILDRKGDAYSTFYEFYDGFTKIKNIKIKVFDENGMPIKTVKKKEIKDYAAEDGFSLYNDTRVLYYHYISNKYPYTISISYDIITSNTAFIPRFAPIHNYDTGIEKSIYTITHPTNLKLNYKETESKYFSYDKNVYPTKMEFSIHQVKPISSEDFAPSFKTLVPSVAFGLENFSLAGVKGSAHNWAEMGDWIQNKLLNGRSQISETTRNKILNLTKDAPNDLEKAKRVYKFMQDKTRYVSIQIGIGGWRPMPAMEVDQKAYGDCKALVNYTKSLMEVAGVKTYYTLVYGGSKRNIDKNLVSIQGNHAILMFPSKKDTIWLECTSQKNPFGHLGNFTDDRDVFIVDKGKSKIVHTRVYQDDENLVETQGDVFLNDQLGFKAKIHIKNCGKAYDRAFYIKDEKKEKQILHYKNAFSDLNIKTIDSIQFDDDKAHVCFNQDLQFAISNYISTFQDHSYFFRLNFFSILSSVPPKNRDRKYPIYIPSGFRHHDKINIELPAGYSYESIPKDVKIESEFGKYTMHVTKLSNQKMVYERDFILKEGTYPKEKYKAFRSFLKKIHKSDLKKAIIKKN